MDSSNDTTVKNSKIKDYGQLLKPNLSFLVVFSSVIAYLLVPGVHFELSKVIILFAGGMLVTGAANAINQILEKDSDRLMKRTMFRPLPDARMQRAEAWLFALLTAFAGAALLALSFNLLTGILSLVSLLLYAFAYTPLKKISPIAVLVGAIPGAMPPLLGWVAATNRIGFEGAGTGGWILFAVQLAVNFCWSLLFFYCESPGWALIDILLMWVLILMTIFSFHPVKAIAAGEGGMITTNDEALAKKLRLYRGFGIESPDNIVQIGTNAKLSEFHAVMGLANFEQLDTARIRAKKKNTLFLLMGVQS